MENIQNAALLSDDELLAHLKLQTDSGEWSRAVYDEVARRLRGSTEAADAGEWVLANKRDATPAERDRGVISVNTYQRPAIVRAIVDGVGATDPLNGQTIGRPFWINAKME